MTREEALKELREAGVIYFRANHSVHYASRYGFWENFKGDETNCYKSLDALIAAEPHLDDLIQQEPAQ